MHKTILKPITKKDYDWVNGFLEKHWKSAKIVSRGKITDANKLPGFIAYYNNQPVGLVTYLIKDN